VSSLVQSPKPPQFFIDWSCLGSSQLSSAFGTSRTYVTSDLSPQRVEQRTSPAAFDVAGLLVARSAMALNDAIICAGLAGGIG
jgi:hypothetical protein